MEHLQTNQASGCPKRKSSYLPHAALNQDLCSSLSFVEAKGLAQNHTGNLCGSVLHQRVIKFPDLCGGWYKMFR